MLDPELKNQLEKLDQHLLGIFHKTESWWRAFVRGMMQGLGSIVGVALGLILLGWVLNTIGVIPAFREQAKSWQQTLDEIKKAR